VSRELPFHPSDEERVAAGMARELEAMAMTSPAPVSDGFADRVMLAIADEPLPQPVRAFGLALFGGHVRAALAAIGDSWRTISSTPAPLAVRAQALALVLVVVVGSLTIAGGAAVGALGLLQNNAPTPSGPPSSQPLPSAVPSPSPVPTPSASPSPSTDVGPSQTPDDETPEPTETGSDDHGGGSGSGSDTSGSGSGDHTPSPTSTDTSGKGD
jgi:hypothetical protein